MLRHADVWTAIDRLAAAHGLSPSGLARRAGLDPTAFNKSKRVSPQGKQRWPSTESVSKMLAATGATLAQFVGFVDPVRGGPARVIPLIGSAQAGEKGYFDDAGYPVGGGWDEIPFPEVDDAHAYALEVSGDSMEPVYRDGDRLIVTPSAGLRRGDRVVVKTAEGEVMVKELVRLSAKRIELRSLNPHHEDRTFDLADVAWIGRVSWVSQ
ncbi:MAG: helix-turn-helix transcriptional regulator [Alphaproteobacteria bacterium]|nr:helix-turn-helix transcriptional regulator [Alphaproteobacteria bacterium]MBF0128645.1 helix-turn-helix transcriptional regulator [Alphaproteobacteria bacterium]